jgi:ABC-type transport system involved in cytochrome c biogenesis permease subunit
MAHSEWFDFLPALYLLCFVLGVVSLVTHKKALTMAATGMGWVTWLAHTALLVMRGLQIGFLPALSLYATLVFFSWLLWTLWVCLDRKRAMPGQAGPILSALACMLTLLAALQTGKDVTLAQALLRSRWFVLHLVLTNLALAFFVVAAAFAWMRKVALPERAGDPLLPVSIGVAIVFPVISTHYLAVPHGPIVLTLAGAGFGFHAFKSLMNGRWEFVDPERAQETRRWYFGFGTAGLLAVLVLSLWANAKVEGFYITKHPLHFSLIALAFLLALLMLVLTLLQAGSGLREMLPPAGKYERWSYQLALRGFLFLTLGGIAGAVWSARAYGDYWTWSPHEIWLLVLWCFYAIYLQLRQIENSPRDRGMALLIPGLLIVMVTLWQANLLPQ